MKELHQKLNPKFTKKVICLKLNGLRYGFQEIKKTFRSDLGSSRVIWDLKGFGSCFYGS